ncbi:MAG: Site-specific recombinase related to the invertase Pin [Gammaproteobacteria bacterium]|jgi:DNA invertase Pin-like site-specific DNA recombinase|nr:Site-specific recombinase related to the invertase Pin [Gammaproteobacteria bacterium]
MTCYIYTHKESADSVNEERAIQQYIKLHNFTMPKRASDDVSTKTHWGERLIGQLIKNANKEDHIVVYEASHMACSTSQILEMLSMIASRKIHIHFVKYNLHIANQSEQVDTQHILQLISKIESDFISKRTSQALARRKAAGLPLGRPKGRGNKSLKLDKFRQDIKKYLDLGISKASIAKLVDCHPQTLYDWLDRNDFAVTEEERAAIS